MKKTKHVTPFPIEIGMNIYPGSPDMQEFRSKSQNQHSETIKNMVYYQYAE